MPGYSKRWERLAAKAKAYYLSHPELDAICWLCRRPIDLGLPHNDRYAFTMDHVIPKILGGFDIETNALPAHRSCNTRRSNDKQYKAIVNGAIRVSREW